MADNDAPKGVELLACPFCGGQARLWHQRRNNRENTFVQCEKALCNTVRHGIGRKRADREADAVSRWNARANVEASVSELRAEVANLKTIVHHEHIVADVALKRAERLAEALRLALDSHGVMLMTDPPQDAWKARGVAEKAQAALTNPAQPGETE